MMKSDNAAVRQNFSIQEKSFHIEEYKRISVDF